jgi:hypothetical protein
VFHTWKDIVRPSLQEDTQGMWLLIVVTEDIFYKPFFAHFPAHCPLPSFAYLLMPYAGIN